MNKDTRKNKRMRTEKRCDCCNRIVSNHPVVLVEHARDYVKKLGYLVSRFRLMLSFLLFLPLVSANTWLTLDVSSRFNIFFFLIAFVIVGILCYLRLFVFASFILIILGTLFLYNGVNILIVLLTVVGGVVLAFIEK